MKLIFVILSSFHFGFYHPVEPTGEEKTTIKSLDDCKYEVNFTVVDVLCHGEATGRANLDITPDSQINSTGPFTILWTQDGDNRMVRDDLRAGVHTVKVTDSEGCALELLIPIDEPDPLETNLIVENVKCHGQPDGSINLQISGGVTPYNYSWSNGETTQDINTLLAGEYRLEVRDKNFCPAKDTAVLTQPPPIGFSPTVIPVSCFGGSDGTIDVVVFGGTIPYRYSWTNTDTIPRVINLPAGPHTLTVTDGNNCIEQQTINMPQPTPIEVDFEVVDVNCFEGTDGEILATVIGGTPDYRYQWSNSGVVLGDTTNHPKGLFKDFYTLLVTDANSCEQRLCGRTQPVGTQPGAHRCFLL